MPTPANRNRYSDKFKLRAVEYMEKHPELSMRQCASYLGIGQSTLSRWKAWASSQAGDTTPESGGPETETTS